MSRDRKQMRLIKKPYTIFKGLYWSDIDLIIIDVIKTDLRNKIKSGDYDSVRSPAWQRIINSAQIIILKSEILTAYGQITPVRLTVIEKDENTLPNLYYTVPPKVIRDLAKKVSRIKRK